MVIQENGGLGRERQPSVGYGPRPQSSNMNMNGMGPMGDIRYGQSNNPNSVNHAYRLSQLVNAASRSANSYNNNNDPSEGFKSFSYNKSKTENIFAGMFDEEILSDEQYKLGVINNAAEQAQLLYHALHNRNPVFYKAAKEAMEFFRRDQHGNIQMCFDDYINEVENNIQLYRYIASNACVLFTHDITRLTLSGEIDALKDKTKVYELIKGNFFNILALQYLVWLEGNPQGLTIYHSMTPANKRALGNIENNIDELQNRYIFISVENINYPFPWKKGTIKRMLESVQVRNPILDEFNFYDNNGDGTISWYMNSSNHSAHNKNAAWETLEILKRCNNNNINVNNDTNPDNDYFRTNSGFDYKYDEHETKRTYEERLERAKNTSPFNYTTLNKDDYFLRVTDSYKQLYVIRPEYFRYISQALTLKSKGEKVPYWRGMWNVQNTIPVVELDWERGEYDYRLVSLGNVDIVTILTDPNKVLPLISKDPTKEAMMGFEEYVKETTYYKDEENNPIPIPRKITEEEKPKVVYGDKPCQVESNEDITDTINTASNYYDPGKQLDAFIIPYNHLKSFKLEDHYDYEQIYDLFPSLVVNNNKHKELESFVNEIKRGLSRIEGSELETLIRGHLTNIINRWLVECRYYPEKKEEGRIYIKVHDFIDDYHTLCSWLYEKDTETLHHLLNLSNNEFLKENFNLFATKEEREKFLEKELTKYSDELYIVKKKQTNSFMVVKREFLLTRINPMVPLSGYDQVVLPASEYPEFHCIYEDSLAKMEKHFGRKVPFLVTFSRDPDNRLWVVTKSDFDDKVYSFRLISTISTVQLLRIAQ